ncbi:MAG: hypothetical protein A2583_04295 [Bdellovibrionales bacterium RIFOXYD1_FULL_53_11]|nr:MAG: hypothetical protein A2583_04295 [Bdellovibrionales bacterium RIFOXYD1_FULL_53_11]
MPVVEENIGGKRIGQSPGVLDLRNAVEKMQEPSGRAETFEAVVVSIYEKSGRHHVRFAGRDGDYVVEKGRHAARISAELTKSFKDRTKVAVAVDPAFRVVKSIVIEQK